VGGRRSLFSVVSRHNKGAERVKDSRGQRLREEVSYLPLRSDVDELDTLRVFHLLA